MLSCRKLNCLFLFGLLVCLAITAFTPLQAAQPMQPAELDTITRTEIQFYWEPEMEAESYHLQIAGNEIYDPFEVALIAEYDVNTNSIIVSDVLEWGDTYVWQYWWLDSEGNIIDTSFIHQFSIADLPDSTWEYEIEVIDEDALQPGYRLIDSYSDVVSVIKPDGTVVWFYQSENSVREAEMLPNGNVLFLDDWHLKEMDLDWNSSFISEAHDLHHSASLLPNGNYMALSHVFFHEYDPRGVEDSVLWGGDRIIEFNRSNDTLWYWDTRDHWTTADLDTNMAYNRRYPYIDWTHNNTAHYCPEENAVYTSARHLHRIAKIDYESGEVLWNCGTEFGSGDIDFGENLGFSAQHHPWPQPNGNVMLFDNHNAGPDTVSRAIEFSIDMQRDPIAQIEWEYRLDVYAFHAGESEKLPNGNVLITATGARRIEEVSWEGERLWMLNGGFKIYRTQAIDHLYPLAYTIKGPKDSDHIPAGESYFQFDINNIGWADQWFVYSVLDEQGWFDVEDVWIHVPAGETVVATVHGQAADGEAESIVNIEVHPAQKAALRDSWTATLVSDPNMSVRNGESRIPNDLSIEGNYPNPFNSQTTIRFGLNADGPATLTMYDSNGRYVNQIANGHMKAGHHQVSWDGKDRYGNVVPSGNYFAILRYGGKKVTHSLTFIR